VIENGQTVIFEDGEMKLGERLPGGYVFVDGAGVGDIGPSVVREREALARDGFVLVNLTLERDTGLLHEEPEIITRGFIYTREADELMDATRKLIQETIWKSEGDVLQEDLQQALKAFFFNETKRRPMIFVTLSRA
jgi:ribonuclease J